MEDGVYEYERDGYQLSTDHRRLDVAYIHAVLRNSAWAAGLTRDVLVRSIENSLAFGLYSGSKQIGFARVVTDRATFAFLTDVFVDRSCRNRGLSRIIIEGIISHPDLQGLRRFLLVTKDAHGLYNKFGFSVLAYPERFMERIGAPPAARSAQLE